MTQEFHTPEEDVKSNTEESKSDWLNTLANSEEIREAFAKLLSEIPQLVKGHMQTKARWMTMPTLLLIIVVICAIIGTTTYLGIVGKLSSDAIAFLFGAIVGASFTFLQKFLPSR